MPGKKTQKAHFNTIKSGGKVIINQMKVKSFKMF